MAQALLLSDQEFLQLQKGNAAVFRKVYVAYYSLVQYVIFRCGIDDEEKRDLIQETFLRLHTKAHEIRDPMAVKAWLVACARNLSIDFQRQKQKKTVTLDEEKADALVDHRADEQREELQRELEIKLVSRLIQEVCAQEGDDTFKLFYIDGLKAREIAEQRGEAVSTVTTRISRLRQKFQQVFLKHLEQLEREAETEMERLLSDEDFLRLMEAEHALIKTQPSDLEKEQIWQQLRKKIRPRFKPWLPLLLVAALLGLVLLPLVQTRQDETGIKGSGEVSTPALELVVLESGQNLAFRFSSPSPLQLALVLQKNAGGEAPDLLYRTREPLVGESQLLGQDGQVYVYEWEAHQEVLHFCLIAASDAAQLDQVLKGIKSEDLQKRGDACQTFTTP